MSPRAPATVLISRAPRHVLTAAERGRRWAEVVAAYPGYETYQKRTTRRIPLVLLTAHDN
ncbi:nitroreductase/quinone reductase family protein [Nocardia implantans]|uniref:Nitroreductase/quinone reductase family protein n=1 Tax=Nocardia implantans TaxID=3108168 RepID=A0ABU6ATS7_9NOCA|nr:MULTISPECIES: nitroreductase/quinone reductase family protein [unclassified Nocardia]MBF6191226.1 nitroreductase family deazaflavin-dependent oxidoreductase [Nocardia beijingensis]MEA3529225.1 nitroreductase/quinone reductase family protein [Nocardia sp. CDC192]MEB3510890.1 nitroreductase/quinone reductase family protein [Nocardia sp. CDC186]